jgi:hypothetical protein
VHSSYCNSAYGRTAWGTCCKATWAGGTGCIVSDVGLGSNERGRQTLSVPADPERAASLIVLTAAEGDDERVIDGADGAAGFVDIVAASASTCRSPYERAARAGGHSRQCCRAASAPRARCAPPVRVGLPPIRTGRLARHAVTGCRQGGGADHRVRGRELSTVRRHGRCRAVVIGSGGEHVRARCSGSRHTISIGKRKSST